MFQRCQLSRQIEALPIWYTLSSHLTETFFSSKTYFFVITVDYLCLIPKYNSIESIKPQSLNGQSFPSLYILSYCAVQGWFRDSITPLVACWKGSASGCIADSLNQKLHLNEILKYVCLLKFDTHWSNRKWDINVYMLRVGGNGIINSGFIYFEIINCISLIYWQIWWDLNFFYCWNLDRQFIF